MRTWRGWIIFLFVGLAGLLGMFVTALIVAGELEGFGLFALLPFVTASGIASVWSWNQEQVRAWSWWKLGVPALLLAPLALFASGFSIGFGALILALGALPLGLLIHSRLARRAG